MKQLIFVTALLVGMMALGVRPAAAADKEQRQMMAELRMLQDQTQQLQNALNSLAETLKAVNATVNTRLGALDSRLDSRLDEQTNATRKALADQKLVVDAISSDLRVVREKVDDNNVRVGSLTQEVDALRQLVQQAALARPSPVETVDAAAATNPDAAATPTAAPPPAGVATIGASPQKLWDGAFSDYGAAQYDLAILGFQAYIKSFPGSDRADDAQVLIGNAYLQQGKYEQAAAAYDAAIRTYPAGDAIPEAYLKNGIALKSLKRIDAAREAFETVAKKYPENQAATLANQQLQDLKKP